MLWKRGLPIVVLCGLAAASPGFALEGAPDAGPRGSGGGNASGGPPPADLGPVRADNAYANLRRRADVKTLIAKGAHNVAPGHHQPLFRPGVGGTYRNAIGATVPGNPSPLTGSIGHAPGSLGQTLGSIAANSPANHPSPRWNTGPLHGQGINGTGFGRNVAGTGSVGGPSVDRAGVNGTSMRPRH